MSQISEVKQAVKQTQIATVSDFIKSNKDLISRALPNHIGVERLSAMFTIVIRSNPKISQCTPMSLIGALVQTAQLGLMPGNIDHCYYVPFYNNKQLEVQFILGYKGMIELVNRSNQACILSTEVVYENDYFEYALGLDPKLVHVPCKDQPRGEITGTYCVAKNLLANEKVFLYLPKEDIDKIKGSSKSANSEYSPWNKWYSEMAKKTAVKRICKILPLAVDIRSKIETDETVKHTINADIINEKDQTDYSTDAEVLPEQEGENGKKEESGKNN